MEWIIQKTVELGVTRIVPVMTKRTVVKLDAKKAGKKTERYQAIALAAAKQSGRGIIPEVTAPVTWKEALAMAKELDMNMIPYEEAEGVAYSKEVFASIKGKKKSWYIYRSGRWICQRRSRDSGSYGREDGHTWTQDFAYRDGRNGGYVDHNV